MVQTDWTSLGGPPAAKWGSRPSVARNFDGSLAAFVLDSAGALWQIQQSSPGKNWTSWASLNPQPNTNIAPNLTGGLNADGRLEIFSSDTAGALWHTWQTSPGGGWSDWFSLGTPQGVTINGSLAVIQNADGRLEVFTFGSDGSLWHIWQTAPNANWSHWSSLAKPPGVSSINVPVVGTNADGRLEAFTVGNSAQNRDLWHIWQTAGGRGWSNWVSLGTPQVTFDGPLAVAQNADGRLEVFAIAESRSLWHIWQTRPNGSWSRWSVFDGPLSASMIGAPLIAKNADGRLEVFLTTPEPLLWHTWQVTGGGSWSNWTSFDTPSNLSINSDPSVSENADGRLEVFLTGSDQALWHAWQVSPGGPWGT